MEIFCLFINKILEICQNFFLLFSPSWLCFQTFLKPDSKIWPSTGRIDDVYGDKNLVCTCPPMEEYVDEMEEEENWSKKILKRKFLSITCMLVFFSYSVSRVSFKFAFFLCEFCLFSFYEMSDFWQWFTYFCAYFLLHNAFKQVPVEIIFLNRRPTYTNHNNKPIAFSFSLVSFLWLFFSRTTPVYYLNG